VVVRDTLETFIIASSLKYPRHFHHRQRTVMFLALSVGALIGIPRMALSDDMISIYKAPESGVLLSTNLTFETRFWACHKGALITVTLQ
jgi:hypothetical protein